MLFNLDFPNNTILSFFFFFVLITDLYFLIPVVIEQNFNPFAEVVMNTNQRSKSRNRKISSNRRS